MKHPLNGPKLLVKSLIYSYLTMVSMRCFILVRDYIQGFLEDCFLGVLGWITLWETNSSLLEMAQSK